MATTAPHTKAIGDATEAMVLARLIQAGKHVLNPFGDNLRYDLVVDEGDHFVRVQCKTGRLENGVIKFATCSTNYHHPTVRRDYLPYRRTYRDSADLFGIFCPQTDGVYLIPVAEVGTVAGTLRVAPTRNRQVKRIRWAKDYEIGAPGLGPLRFTLADKPG